ncbi:hypothetical protein JXB12_05855 [candidate division KSB1 bacterium]|nr:hypothetical protein [candidate division KSB1 bacterium]
MSLIEIGRVRGGKSHKSYSVFWDSSSREIYVGYAGRTFIGKASSAQEAMHKADAWVFDK